eukprot:TRINITY_DN8670_c0_g1_i4.p1 TRINITY_DN8670_c0_g1~~TRINITY_DN8670_c0_g1_i4.p1  ORF type:complete len:477 (-),score=51.75 TRINITY_DN8670_c0_g1_i4:119-1474(-)
MIEKTCAFCMACSNAVRQRLRSPPDDWMLALFYQGSQYVLIMITTAFVLAASFFYVYISKIASILPAMCACAAASTYACGRFLKVYPRCFQIIRFLFCCITGGAMHFFPLHIEDAYSRSRFMGSLLSLFKLLPVAMGLKAQYFIVFIIWECIAQILSHWSVSKLYDDDGVSSRINAIYFGMTFYSMFFACLAIIYNVLLQKFYDVGVQLEWERHSSQLLIDMHCDAIFWLNFDGDLVVRCDRRFDNIMGQPMLGQSIKGLLHDTLDERTRWERAFPRVSSLEFSPVGLLPTTTLNALHGPVSVDLYVVRHVRPNSEASRPADDDAAYLVGLRLCESQGAMIFDFSGVKRLENAATIVSNIFVCAAGDALLEPFWPEGLGIMRGFMSAMDAAAAVVMSTKGELGRDNAVSQLATTYNVLKSVAAQSASQCLQKDMRRYRLAPETRYIISGRG